MTPTKTQTKPIGWIIAAAAAAAAAVFAIDVLLPIGYPVPMLYVLPVMITRYAPGWWSTGLMTGMAVALTWIGMALSPGELTRQVGVSRAMASVLLLLVAGLVFKQKHLAQQRDADQEALRESEERFRSFFENAAIGAAQINSTGRFIHVNDRFCQITGYSHEELVGKLGPLDLDHPEEVEADRKRIADFFRQGTPYLHHEKRYVRKDGNLVWVRVTVAPARDAQGVVHGTVAIIEDITERKRAEAALRESEERLRLALESARLGTWDWDGETDAVLWDHRQYELFGIRPEGFHGTSADALSRIHAEDRPRMEAAVRSAMEKGVTFREEFRVVHGDGSVHWLFGAGRPMRVDGGRNRHVVGVNLDITEHRQAQEGIQRLNERLEQLVRKRTAALVEANERWDWVVRATNDGVWDWDLVHDTAYFSPRWKEMHGFDESDPPESATDWLSRIHPEDRPRVLAAFDRCREGKGLQFYEEYRIQKKDGAYFGVLDRGIAVFNDEGRAIRMIGAESDITWRKEAEEALRRREHEFRTLADNVPAFFGYIDRNRRYRFVNKRYEEFFGRSDEEIAGMTMRELFGLDGYAAVEPHLDRAFQGESVLFEYRLAVHGENHWFSARYVPDRDERRQVAGLFVLLADVTELKTTEQQLRERETQLRDLGARLLQAQEEERRRISRDLHDDIMQRMGALTLDLYGLVSFAAPSGGELQAQLKACGASAEQLTTDLQRLAHQLHPSVLEYGGLEAAMREHVNEFASRTGVTAEFVARDVPKDLPLEYATCLYRVMQEGL
ncbi:MAG: PAS domain S-box protein, partial [Nitrospira sp.]|nr:PAS domain S-box protein [Nitrospira sp.]